MDGDGHLELLGAYHIVYPITVPGALVSPPPDHVFFRKEANRAVQAAAAEVRRSPEPTVQVVEARPTEALLQEAERQHATLIAVGSHGHGRISGILLGSTATELVHKADCSVLVARARLLDLVKRIVVGIDGSPESAAAYAVAAGLAQRFGGELRAIVSTGGHTPDLEAVEAITADYRIAKEDPVRALAAAGVDADLVVVGSRGLHGVRALGSVSERVAHRSRTSTLVVRASI